MSEVWSDAGMAAALVAVDPGAIGVSLRAAPGPARDRWLARLRTLLPQGGPVRRVPLNVADGRLLGGLNLAATLRAGRPIAERGILAETDGGVVLLAMAERLSQATAARLSTVLDRGEVVGARDGIDWRNPARLGVVALDEGIEEERPPAALLERLALLLRLDGTEEDGPDAETVDLARRRLPGVRAEDDMVRAICAAALALGVFSIRASQQAMRVACAAAALAGRDAVSQEDAALAARMVLAPRATMLPATQPPPDAPEQEPEQEPEPEPETDPDGGQQPEPQPDPGDEDSGTDRPAGEIVLEAASAAIPAGLLAKLQAEGASRSAARAAAGRSGALQNNGRRGRPAGVRRGPPRASARLNVVETLRAAAPWQRLRRAEPGGPVQIRAEDFHVTRIKQRAETTTIFVVDASGSSALNRLAEAKGAVELLLADCYVRRDRVAVLAFRGRAAELLLPPTRSLVRAKRSLSGLPGGGGTPLASAIEAAAALAHAARRRGETPTIVMLTDGRGNIARDGTPSRDRAEQDAIAAARLIRVERFAALLVDTSPRPQPQAQAVAAAMGARYLPLPFARAAALSQAVRAVAATSPA